jgi:hypothetical protein
VRHGILCEQVNFCVCAMSSSDEDDYAAWLRAQTHTTPAKPADNPSVGDSPVMAEPSQGKVLMLEMKVKQNPSVMLMDEEKGEWVALSPEPEQQPKNGHRVTTRGSSKRKREEEKAAEAEKEQEREEEELTCVSIDCSAPATHIGKPGRVRCSKHKRATDRRLKKKKNNNKIKRRKKSYAAPERTTATPTTAARPKARKKTQVAKVGRKNKPAFLSRHHTSGSEQEEEEEEGEEDDDEDSGNESSYRATITSANIISTKRQKALQIKNQHLKMRQTRATLKVIQAELEETLELVQTSLDTIKEQCADLSSF